MLHGSNTQFLTPKVTNMAASVFTYGPNVKPDVATFVTLGVKMEYLIHVTYCQYMSKIGGNVTWIKYSIFDTQSDKYGHISFYLWSKGKT